MHTNAAIFFIMKIAVDLPNYEAIWQVVGGVMQYTRQMDDVELVLPQAGFLPTEACGAEYWDGLITEKPRYEIDIPQVVLSPVFLDTSHVCVSFCWRDVIKLAVRQFSSMGLASLAFFTRPEYKLGWNTYCSQLKRLGIEPVFITVEESKRMLLEIPKPCGIVVPIVDLGLELLQVCSELGLKIPVDVHVITIGDSPKFLDSTPTLSSIPMAYDELGYRAAEKCITMCKGIPVEMTLMIRPTGLVLRDSVDVNNVRISTAAQIAQYLRSNFSYPIRMEDLQRRSSMSRRQLERLFRSVYGTSPIAYLNDLRFDHAKRMLESSGLPIKEIASECGYCSHTHFCRVFQNTAGTSPSDYRKQYSKT